MIVQTTLFHLLDKADIVEIDGYEVESETYLPGGRVRLNYCGDDERSCFSDQPVEFSDGDCRAVTCADDEYDLEADVVCQLTFKVTNLLMPEDL